MSASRRPNILFIQCDQMAAPVLPFYGGKVVRAPHMERLAAEGTVFESAYCNSPLCAPSRFSMMAGQLPSVIGAYDNAAAFGSDQPTFAHALRELGYATTLCGKMHFVGPDQLHGFEERLTTDIYPADFGWTPNWDAGEDRQEYFHSMLSVVEAGSCARSMQLDYDDEVAFQAKRKIYDLGRSNDERPFFLLTSFTHPHDPYCINEPYWSQYRDEDIDLPAVPALSWEEQDPHSRRLYNNYDIDRYDLNEARVRRARRAYYGAIAYLDDQIGGLLAALDATGQRDNTVIILTGDHGDMLGERGLWYKMSFFEWSARVPLVISAPGRLPAGRQTMPVSLLDLFPTLIDCAAGGEPSSVSEELPATLPGESLLPWLRSEKDGEGRFVPGEYLAESAAGPMAMLRQGRFKYVVGEGSPAQLFDLTADPLELSNLAGTPEHADLEASFAREVAARWDFVAAARRGRRQPTPAALRLPGAEEGRARSLGFPAAARRRALLCPQPDRRSGGPGRRLARAIRAKADTGRQGGKRLTESFIPVLLFIHLRI